MAPGTRAEGGRKDPCLLAFGVLLSADGASVAAEQTRPTAAAQRRGPEPGAGGGVCLRGDRRPAQGWDAHEEEPFL